MDVSNKKAIMERIEKRIMVVRSQKIMLDADLAQLYGVTTKRLNEQVKRNKDRFPPDFMFQLTPDEKSKVVANCDHLKKLKFSSTMPYAFTEHGAIMAASVLNTPRAIEVSVFVVRAFVKLRELVASQQNLTKRLQELERKIAGHDVSIRTIMAAIRQLIESPETQKQRQIGFTAPED